MSYGEAYSYPKPHTLNTTKSNMYVSKEKFLEMDSTIRNAAYMYR